MLHVLCYYSNWVEVSILHSTMGIMVADCVVGNITEQQTKSVVFIKGCAAGKTAGGYMCA